MGILDVGIDLDLFEVRTSKPKNAFVASTSAASPRVSTFTVSFAPPAEQLLKPFNQRAKEDIKVAKEKSVGQWWIGEAKVVGSKRQEVFGAFERSLIQRETLRRESVGGERHGPRRVV